MKDFYIRILVVLLGLAQPIVILIVCGVDFHSISASWFTCLQPLFIFTNALTSYYFYNTNNWRLSGILLLLLTAFSVESYLVLHNIFAISFFVSCFYSIFMLRKFRFYIIFYVIAVIIGILKGLFWGEFAGVYVLSLYHVHVLLYYNSLLEKKTNKLGIK